MTSAETGAVLEGVTLTGGTDTRLDSGWRVGAGLAADSAEFTVRDVAFHSNETSEGGYGGGVFAWQSDVTIEDCAFLSNQAYDGGAAYFYESTIDLQDVRFEGNRSTHWSSAGNVILQCSEGSIRGSTWLDNVAEYGSALAVYACGSEEVVIENLLAGPQGADSGYLVYIYGSSSVRSASVIIRASIFADVDDNNAVYLYYSDISTLIENVVFADSEGVAVGGYTSDVQIRNSIFVGNDTAYESGASVTSSLFFGNRSITSGTSPVGTDGNISEDPVFVDYSSDGDPTNDDLRLDVGSPAIDAGSSASAYDDPDGSRNDMGAFGGPAGDWTPAW
ncbi:right-handed parallel beta-helix repeat-containing protein [Myxococcota bacterium]|nr:right-handed parallel beta-helix repeat-containing protein [Myxococcota bacterium]